MNCRILPIRYGETDLKESWIFAGGRDSVRRPISLTVYLIECGNRKILVDAGCDTMPGFHLKYHISPPKALEKLGIRAEEITDVILTHAHHDHAEAVGHFRNAVIYLQREEYEGAKKYLPQGCDLRLFDEECAVAPGVRALCWGGHTPGSCTVEVGKTVIVGDECYSSECIKKQIPTGISHNPEQSKKFIEYYRTGWEILTAHDA